MAPTAAHPALPLRGLSLGQRADFERDGFLVLRDLLPSSAIMAVRGAFDRVVRGHMAALAREGLVADGWQELPFERMFAAAGADADRFGRSWREQVACQEVFALHHEPALLAVIGDLLGGEGICGHRVFNARPKLPGQHLTIVPWHQDSGYFGAASESQRIITAWVPLVPVSPSDGGMQVARGSHRSPMPHRQEADPRGFLEIVGHQPDERDIVDVATAPGDVLLFGNLTWHRSLANLGERIRWSIDIRFYAESIAGAVGGEEGPPWIISSATRPATTLSQWLAWARG